ncbi:MAG: YggS family pyridoxal phosphate-dependent enzyme [Armatimonadetes bacterium]|nr:YggS family pyridoxal phosphate-dependent enzyme [Armatimonadota bacterium]
MDDIAARVAEIRDRIARAAESAGRAAGEVTLVAAAKTRSAAEVDSAIAAGVTDIGENYVQEAEDKRARVAGAATWRMIGHLQRNKAGAAAAAFDTADTIDSARLAEALERRLAGSGRIIDVLMEIHLGGEASKSGVEPAGAHELLNVLQQMPSLRCLGVMTMPPPAAPETARRWFSELRELAECLRRSSGLPLRVVSMGMSQDFEAAVAEGATHVRIGTALFGPRS